MKVITNKKSLIILMPLLVGLGIFVIGASTHASWAEEILTGILSIFIWALGIILGLVLQGLIAIASYQHFIDSQAVVLGWVIVRDVCNMFFVVVLMIIAFGTILHLEEYNYKKWLPKLILMAVLINFSKTICGVLIDVTQVAMLTFVNAFKDIGGGNATDMLGIKDIVTLSASDSGTGTGTIVGAYVLGIIYLIVSIVVIVTMMMMLAMRLVMIWIYVVLSPAAYLLAAFPGGQKYSSQWWSEFTKNLIVGPVLAFFIWLSLAALGTGNDTNNITATADTKNQQYNDTLKGDSFAGTEASKPSALIKFVVAIGMLIGGLMISQQIGGAAGGLAGKGMSALQKGQAMGMAGLKGLAKAPMLPVNYVVDKLQQHSGVDLNVKRAWGVMQAKRKEVKEKQYSDGQGAAREAMESGGRIHGMLAITGNAGDAYEQMSTWKGFKQRLKGGRAMEEDKNIAESQEKSGRLRFENAEYENEFINADKTGRLKMINESDKKLAVADKGIKSETKKISDIDKEISAEEAKGQYKDVARIEQLKASKKDSEANLEGYKNDEKIWNYRSAFAVGNKDKIFSDQEKFNARGNRDTAAADLERSKDTIAKNTHEYSFEARGAEQRVVGQELSKIKDISDPSELLRILENAIQTHDKTMVKAITLKMTKDYNDNEFLQPLAGRTDHKGLKDLMRQFSTEGSKNYAGFSQQEAFGLGSQIAELNKSTNHWGASSAYVMENGKFRETTDKEHHNIRDIETGKQQLQSFIRNNNRLAYGYHDKGGKFHLDAGGVLKLKAINNLDGFSNISTMNESAAKYCYDAIKEANKNGKLLEFTKALKDKNGKVLKDREGNEASLMYALEKRLGDIANKANFDEKYDEEVSSYS